MIERAQANATAQAASLPGAASGPSFVVGNVAEMPFGDASFDIVISTLSMHHWSDVPSGLAEISRVLRPNGRVLIWDIRPEVMPFHRPAPDAAAEASPLQVIDRRPWRWPWRFRILNRIELGAPASEAAS
jgi:ubiquinone/menaquinone biosynthesis C-methylase UbiE